MYALFYALKTLMTELDCIGLNLELFTSRLAWANETNKGNIVTRDNLIPDNLNQILNSD